MAQGWHVFRAESPHAPFDLVGWRDGELLRIEVKTGLSREKATHAPSFAWPVNDDWDLLLVVMPSGECVEIVTHDREAARDAFCERYGYTRKPAPRWRVA